VIIKGFAMTATIFIRLEKEKATEEFTEFDLPV
jgi:hypothetical protein